MGGIQSLSPLHTPLIDTTINGDFFSDNATGKFLLYFFLCL